LSLCLFSLRLSGAFASIQSGVEPPHSKVRPLQ
jgi:hypothetical protein